MGFVVVFTVILPLLVVLIAVGLYFGLAPKVSVIQLQAHIWGSILQHVLVVLRVLFTLLYLPFL